MPDQTADEQISKPKSLKFPLIIGLVLALAGGGGGFFATQSGLLGLGGTGSEATAKVPASKEKLEPLKGIAFVEIPPFTVTMRPGSAHKHMLFRASLEVPSQYADDVTTLMPRIQDVMNGYLRALETADFEAPGALMQLRSHLLHRARFVVGQERVNNLLVLEFVLN